jgi:hypothetical protein
MTLDKLLNILNNLKNSNLKISASGLIESIKIFENEASFNLNHNYL